MAQAALIRCMDGVVHWWNKALGVATPGAAFLSGHVGGRLTPQQRLQLEPRPVQSSGPRGCATEAIAACRLQASGIAPEGEGLGNRVAVPSVGALQGKRRAGRPSGPSSRAVGLLHASSPPWFSFQGGGCVLSLPPRRDHGTTSTEVAHGPSRTMHPICCRVSSFVVRTNTPLW